MATEPTKLRLARVLREHGLHEMAAAAARGRYDDYESDSATPCVDLVNDLGRAGALELRRRAMDGEWDGTKEEADAWAASPEGRSVYAELGHLLPTISSAVEPGQSHIEAAEMAQRITESFLAMQKHRQQQRAAARTPSQKRNARRRARRRPRQ